MLVSAESEHRRLISREIIFEVFVRICSQFLSVTDRHTVRQMICRDNTALYVASRGKNGRHLTGHLQVNTVF